MGRNIPIALQEHLDGRETTTTLLLRISPQSPGYSSYGVTYGNKSLVYDDGDGEISYSAPIGMVPSSIEMKGSMTVDNAEHQMLMPQFDIPVSEEDIRAGIYDFANAKLMLVNYEDLSQGHVTLIEGSLGQIKVKDDGLSIVSELRGLIAQLKQSVCAKDSLTCRAIFGSQKKGSSVPGPQVFRDWCGFNAASLLQSASVLEVGIESRRTFRVEVSTDWSENHLNPGLWIFTSGRNSGRSYEIESNTTNGWITLAHEVGYDIQENDEGEYRPDCTHIARDEEKGCKHWYGDSWGLHFRGEPDIPIGDAGQLETPRASSGPGQGGTVNMPFDVEDV